MNSQDMIAIEQVKKIIQENNGIIFGEIEDEIFTQIIFKLNNMHYTIRIEVDFYNEYEYCLYRLEKTFYKGYDIKKLEENIKKMQLDNFRLKALDDKNIIVEEYKQVVAKRTKEIKYKWVNIGGYYTNLERALNFLKEYIINTYADNSYDDIIKKLEELNNAYVKCNIKVVMKCE